MNAHTGIYELDFERSKDCAALKVDLPQGYSRSYGARGIGQDAKPDWAKNRIGQGVNYLTHYLPISLTQ